MLAGKGQCSTGRFGGGQRVHQNPTSLAFDDGHVGNVKATQLIHALGHLEQANVGVKLGMAPQTGVDRVSRFAVQKGVGFEIFEYRAVGHGDFAGGLGNEAARGIFEVLAVVQLQILGKLGVDIQCCWCGITRSASDAAGFATTGGQGH